MQTYKLELTREELKAINTAIHNHQMQLNKDSDSLDPAIRSIAARYTAKLQPVALRVDRLLFSNI